MTGTDQPQDTPAPAQSERLAVHVHPVTAAPLGVWGPPPAITGPVAPDTATAGQARAYILPDAGPAGRDDIAGRAGEGGWDELVSHLVERAPQRARWRTLDAEPDADLGSIIRSLAAEWVEQRWHTRVTLTPGSLAESRYRFAADRALRLACEVGGPEQQWVPDQRASTRLCMFGNNERLVIVVGPQEPVELVDLALAYGMAYAAERDLILVLPAGSERATVMRAPWIELPLEVWTFDSFDRPVYQVLPYADDILGRYRDQVVTAGYVLGQDRALWVDDLIRWADGNTSLVPGHRPDHLAWNCRGRIVLRIATRGSRLEAIGGVRHTDPADDRPPAVSEVLAGPLGSDGLARLVTATEAAVAHRVAHSDGESANETLKAALAADPALLGLASLRREFPAFRPPMVRSYMDFLGIDARGCLHVVETKIGDDDMLVLQGLDYWIWAQAHRRELAELFGLSGTPEVSVDFVIADPGPGRAAGRNTPLQAASLATVISWRFHHVSDWLVGPPGPRPHLDTAPS